MLDHERAHELLRFVPTTGELFWKQPGSKRNLYKPAGHCDKTGYRRIMIEGKMYLAHRLIWLLVHGYWPEPMLDHKDRNPRNNRLDNLEISNHRANGNNSNAKRDNVTGIRGISWTQAGKFTLRLRRKYLGQFNTLEQAIAAKEKFLDTNP